MKEEAIIGQLVSEIDSATANDVGVRTIGGDQDVNPPEVILDWSATRTPSYQGHRPLAAFTTDQSGNQTGREYHMYFRMEVTLILRFTDELERDNTLDLLHQTFLPYEQNATKFDKDTAEWEIGNVQPNTNPIFEPDWYEHRFPLSFVYVKRQTTSDDTLDTVTDSVEINETL